MLLGLTLYWISFRFSRYKEYKEGLTKHNIRYKTENIVHAHYTACMLEEEIRKIREEDHPIREEYKEKKGI